MRILNFCKKNLIFIWCLATSFTILLFTSRSSFFFPYNNWDDANSYFTMGKGLMNHMVIYRDLYDQKGPFLYLLYGICYLISNNSFKGVFLFEIIAATLFLYYSFQIIRRHCNIKIIYMLIPFLAAGIYSSKSFYWGGAAEEFCLPMFAYSLYILNKFLYPVSGDKKISESTKDIFIVGLLTGITSLIKYTMLGFYFAFGVIVLILIIYREGFVKAIKPALIYFLGIVIPFIPWFIFFGVNGALDDWYRCYIFNNLFFYSDIAGDKITFSAKLYKLCKLQYWLFIDNFEYFLYIAVGFVANLFTEKIVLRKIMYPFMYLCTFMFIFYGGGTLPYYSIPLMPFSIIGFVAIGKFLKKISEHYSNESFWYNLGILALIFSIVFAKNNSQSTNYLFTDKDTFWLTEAASHIEEAPNTTLLNVGALDVGLYTITGIVPTCEYFQTNGIALPTMFSEQERYIKEGLTTYVISSEGEPEHIYDHYDLIYHTAFYDNGYDQSYYLYRLR